MANPHCCPVCNGRGSVPEGFYKDLKLETFQGVGIEECKACKGIGIIWDYTNYEYYQYSTSKVGIESNNPCDNCPNKNSNNGCLCTLANKIFYGK